MTLWWWIEPLGMTGLIGLFLAVVLFAMFSECNSRVVQIIFVILLIPFLLAVLGIVAYGFHYVLWLIWHPYF